MLLEKLNGGLQMRKKSKCSHIWSEGILIDLGRNKMWKCTKCNKIQLL